MNFAKAGHEGIGLYLRNVDYRFLEGMSEISPCILLIASSLRVMSTVLYYSGHRKSHIVGHKEFEKELQKYTR